MSWFLQKNSLCPVSILLHGIAAEFYQQHVPDVLDEFHLNRPQDGGI